MGAKKTDAVLFCSFCRQTDAVVNKLIGGPGVYICDACVTLCNRVLRGKPTPGFLGWDSLDDDALLKTLVPAAAAVDAVSNLLHEHVGLLRERGVSWERIGETLGVSRQAVWERFA